MLSYLDPCNQESFRAFEQRYGHRFSSTMQSRIDWTFFGQGSKERDETHAEVWCGGDHQFMIHHSSGVALF